MQRSNKMKEADFASERLRICLAHTLILDQLIKEKEESRVFLIEKAGGKTLKMEIRVKTKKFPAL